MFCDSNLPEYSQEIENNGCNEILYCNQRVVEFFKYHQRCLHLNNFCILRFFILLFLKLFIILHPLTTIQLSWKWWASIVTVYGSFSRFESSSFGVEYIITHLVHHNACFCYASAQQKKNSDYNCSILMSTCMHSWDNFLNSSFLLNWLCSCGFMLLSEGFWELLARGKLL